MHPSSNHEPAPRRGILETTVVVLMAVVLLGMAFLFWNQALLLERLNNSQEMLKDLHTWVKYESTPGSTRTSATQSNPTPNYIPTPPIAGGSRFPSDLAMIEEPAPLRPVAPLALLERQPAPRPAPAVAIPDPEPVLPKTVPAVPVRPTVIAEAPPVTSEPAPVEPRVQIPPPVAPPVTPAARPPETQTAPTPTPAPADPNAGLWEEFGPVVTRVISDLYAGHYDQVTERFTPTFAQHMPKTLLSYTMDRDRSRYGNFKKVLGYKVVEEPQLDQEGLKAFRVTIDTDKSQIIVFTITLTGQKQISGLLFKALPVQTSSN